VKKLLLLLVVLAVAAGAAYFFLVPGGRARVLHAEQEYRTAVKHLEESPPGIPGLEAGVREIRAINVEGCPEEIKQHMKEYADKLEESSQALKQGVDSAATDQKAAEAKAKL
jgi:hypothetical protein